MTRSMITRHVDQTEIKRVRSELLRRRDKLIELARDQKTDMDRQDREHILAFFEKRESPKPPANIPDLMKSFFASCFSYAPLRRYLTSILGCLPDPGNLADCLSEVYSEDGFRIDENWLPRRLHEIAVRIQQRENFDLSSNRFRPRMIRVILDGTAEMEGRLESGLEEFYRELDAINRGPAEEMWKYVSQFSGHIYNVGTALVCDFLKNTGCDRFVKVDHHFKNEFPRLLGLEDCKKLSSKEHFILSQEIADIVEMRPFHLDHLLYQWGRYKKYDN